NSRPPETTPAVGSADSAEGKEYRPCSVPRPAPPYRGFPCFERTPPALRSATAASLPFPVRGACTRDKSRQTDAPPRRPAAAECNSCPCSAKKARPASTAPLPDTPPARGVEIRPRPEPQSPSVPPLDRRTSLETESQKPTASS